MTMQPSIDCRQCQTQLTFKEAALNEMACYRCRPFQAHIACACCNTIDKSCAMIAKICFACQARNEADFACLLCASQLRASVYFKNDRTCYECRPLLVCALCQTMAHQSSLVAGTNNNTCQTCRIDEYFSASLTG